MSAPLATLTREKLIAYFEDAFTPRARWQVGMEVEKMGRRASDGAPVPYRADGPSILGAIEAYRELRGGNPVWEGRNLIGLDSDRWGSISLEPAGQFEWSSRPAPDLPTLFEELDRHLEATRRVGDDLGIRWLEEAVEPELPVDAMPWMPKARYGIMRPYMGAHGRLAHRMMTQTASVQCAYDFADEDDWARKFRAAALGAPIAVALFANSSRVDGADSGWASYRQAIWRETDPERCGLPAVVFEDGFSMGAWIDWVLDVPAMFLRRARGLAPAGGAPFRHYMERAGCDRLEAIDWELHLSGVFTEVRSYKYIEVRSADLVRDPLIPAIPTLWVGVLYHADALEAVLELGKGHDDHAAWVDAMDQAARHGFDGRIAGRSVRDLAIELLQISARGLRDGATCAGSAPDPAEPLARLDADRGLSAL